MTAVGRHHSPCAHNAMPANTSSAARGKRKDLRKCPLIAQEPGMRSVERRFGWVVSWSPNRHVDKSVRNQEGNQEHSPHALSPPVDTVTAGESKAADREDGPPGCATMGWSLCTAQAGVLAS